MSRTIMLVEDEAPIREMLKIVLEQAGFSVNEAEDFDIALEKMVEPYPDLVLLDWMLPGGSGVQLARKLKEHEFTRDIPIIMLTARGEEEDKVRGLEAGADDYITKPFSPQIVKARVRNHLELKLYRDRLMQLSMIDGLTSIPNRRQFDRTVNQEWQRGIRRETPISLLLMDIDFFKQYNDQYGHLKGDDCLKKVAKALSEQLHRPTDMVARYGGEEFVCVLPETGDGGAVHVAKRIIAAMAALDIEHLGSSVATHVSVSIGLICLLPTVEHTLADFIEEADKALYRAKQSGRNRYVMV
ncbi:MAG TPA: diguanylate cyclase response regulator [Glaciecola sp.]|nr:diguanylate cyclase response regulator [Glaciecola sp.]